MILLLNQSLDNVFLDTMSKKKIQKSELLLNVDDKFRNVDTISILEEKYKIDSKFREREERQMGESKGRELRNKEQIEKIRREFEELEGKEDNGGY